MKYRFYHSNALCVVDIPIISYHHIILFIAAVMWIIIKKQDKIILDFRMKNIKI